jgi:hypothetical protein
MLGRNNGRRFVPMNTHRLVVMLLLVSLLLVPFYPFQIVQAADGIAVVDQANIGVVRSYNSIQSYSPVGQSFTPTIPGLDAVELWTEDFTWNNAYGAELYVNIREATMYGTILGTSDTLQLPPRFPFERFPFSGVSHFTFPSLIPLTPGEVYVIEVVVIGGADEIVLHNWGLGSVASDYPGGSRIIYGIENLGNDLWFQEGVASSVPQTQAYCKKGLWAYLSRADGSRFKNTGECMKYVKTGR